MVGSAYTNNFAGATMTTLYAIDSTTDQLLIQNPPNNGTLAPVGPLGVDTSDEVGFDITANDDGAYASLTIGGTTRLHRIDLTTGAATSSGRLAGAAARLAVASRGVPMVALRNGTELVALPQRDARAPILDRHRHRAAAGETLVGIDLRPADGQLYGVGSTSRLYLLNPITGAATRSARVFRDGAVRNQLRRRLQPQVDRLRVVSDTGQNLRINPNNAAMAGVDTPLNPAAAVRRCGLRQQRRRHRIDRALRHRLGSDQLLIP